MKNATPKAAAASDRKSGNFPLVVTLGVLLLFTLITRAGFIGDPALLYDEQFYLLVGDRIWHGAIPYVDIWDRKPILLFLIYAALRPLSPNGIIAYQVGAALSAFATAFLITVIARRFGSARAACLSGVTYLLYLPILGGQGGQSPVFYNLLIALGGLAVLRAETLPTLSNVVRQGLWCMLWMGLAIQIKDTAAIEGACFGIWLCCLLVRQHLYGSVVPTAALWIAVALIPTFVAVFFYALIGHEAEFLQANFISIFQRREPSDFSNIVFLRSSLFKLAPLIVALPFAIITFIKKRTSLAQTLFVIAWMCSSIVDFLTLGNYFDHYALPLLVPTAIVLVSLIDTLLGGTAILFCIAIYSTLFLSASLADVKGHRRAVAALVQAVKPYTADGCIYINDGPPIVYLLSHSCLPTRYVFPTHLNDAEEATAADAARNMKKLLATHPSAILIADRKVSHPRNTVTAAILSKVLASQYKLVATLQDSSPLERNQLLYVRRDLSPKPAPFRHSENLTSTEPVGTVKTSQH